MFAFGIKSMYSPDDPIQEELLNEVQEAKESILMMIYGFHLPSLTDLLIVKHQAGVKVQCVLDHTQASGKAEKVEVQKLIDAGLDVTIGTSPKAHEIMHEKGFCLDGERTITGSYNFSLSAAKQVNHMDFVYSKDRADWFSGMFLEIRKWMKLNEPQDQLEPDRNDGAYIPQEEGAKG